MTIPQRREITIRFGPEVPEGFRQDMLKAIDRTLVLLCKDYHGNSLNEIEVELLVTDLYYVKRVFERARED